MVQCELRLEMEEDERTLLYKRKPSSVRTSTAAIFLAEEKPYRLAIFGSFCVRRSL